MYRWDVTETVNLTQSLKTKPGHALYFFYTRHPYPVPVVSIKWLRLWLASAESLKKPDPRWFVSFSRSPVGTPNLPESRNAWHKTWMKNAEQKKNSWMNFATKKCRARSAPKNLYSLAKLQFLACLELNNIVLDSIVSNWIVGSGFSSWDDFYSSPGFLFFLFLTFLFVLHLFQGKVQRSNLVEHLLYFVPPAFHPFWGCCKGWAWLETGTCCLSLCRATRGIK